jgi:peptidoglycan/LPS O-acetylase OafA/YrhL
VDRVPVINGLRGIAILSVICNHLSLGSVPFSGPFLSIGGIEIPLSPLITNGWTGVNLFFILSGFVLYLPYAAGERRMANWHDGFAFYRRRCRRLLPLFYVAAVAVSALAATHGITWTWLTEAVLLLTLAFALVPGSFGPPFDIPLWSIGVEMMFSVLFPVIALRAAGRGLARWLWIVVAASLALRALGYLSHATSAGMWLSYPTDNITCRLDEFVLGMMLAKLYAEHRLPQRPILFGITGIALVAAAWIGLDLSLHSVWPPVARAPLYDVLDAGFGAIIVAALARGSRLAATLSWAPLQVVGMMCYSLYVWHWPLLTVIAPDRGTLSWTSFAASVAAFLPLSFGVAALSYRFIEFPHVPEWRRLFLLDGTGEATPRPASTPS